MKKVKGIKNHMRNQQELQNYSPSKCKFILSGKNSSFYFITDAMRTKEYWLNLFNQAIEDLQIEGYYISGKGERNSIEYWQKQIEMVNEFEPSASPTWYENKKEYSANWSKENTKSTLIKFNKDDEVWQMIQVLKDKGYKMNAIFKAAIEREYEQIKKDGLK